MFCTYVLRSKKDNKLYIGHTQDLEKRLEEHNAGLVQSTKSRIPFVLVHFEKFATRSEARWQERKWKTAWGHKQLAKFLSKQSVL
ncbi:MAG: GIY-YIG nuclease family protein [Candidatus Omnitrophica bacterium]|nr:GIY-YIG nuclease family protein [Candidatus Omnitrophota bacterium]